MPQMGVSVAEGTVVEWKKRVGDWVETDEPIVEISTDKVETEVPVAGVRARCVARRGGGRARSTSARCSRRIDTGARPGEAHVDEAQTAGRPDQPPPISPVVRRIADEHNIDLAQVKGSGRRGRVTKKDVLAFIEGAEKPEPVLHMESPYVEEAATGPAPAPAPAGDWRAALDHAQANRRTHARLARHRRPLHHGRRGGHERDRGGARAAVVPAVRGARGDRGAARVPVAERHARGRPADGSRGGAPRDSRLARRRRADRPGGAQRPRALARGTRRADRRSGGAGARRASSPRTRPAAARSRSRTRAATGRCSPRRSSTSRRSRSSTSRRWSSDRSWSAGIASESGR